MADWPPKKNAAFTVTFPIYDADGDLVTGAGSLDSEVSKDGGTFTDVSPGEATEIATSSGMYTLALSATEMNADIVATITKSATGKTAPNVMYTVTRQIVDLAYPATSGRSLGVETDGHVHADLKEWLGVAPLALVSQRVNVSVGAMAANVLTATAINADAITAAKVAADVHAEAADAVWDEDIEAAHGTDATSGLLLRALGAGITNRTNTQTLEGLLGIADAATTYLPDSIWDEARAGHVGAGTFGQGVASVQGNVTGSVGSVTGAVGSVTGNVGGNVTGTVGSVVGAVGSVTGSVGGNVTGSVGSIATGGIVAGSFGAGAINAAAIASNAIAAAKIATGAITAAKFAAGAVDAAALNADAANKIADEVLAVDVGDVEGTMALHSLGTAILKAVSRIRDNAGTLEIYRTNGTTIHMSQTITVDSGLDPIDELTVGT